MLGLTVGDRITGFIGVVVGEVTYISGCKQALVVPRAVDNKMVESEWIDCQRLHVLDQFPRVELDNGATPGFDRAPPKR